MTIASRTDIVREISRLLALARKQGEADHYGGKRQHKRFSDAIQLEVTTDPDRSSAAWPVCMQDISDEGVSFWSKRGLALRTDLFIREFCGYAQRPWIPARVKHATVGIRGNLIGVEFSVPKDAPTAEVPAPRMGFDAASSPFPPRFSVRRLR
jgi:hypothetical protein